MQKRVFSHLGICFKSAVKGILVVVVLCFTYSTVNAQTGPGGVGKTDGTSDLKYWIDANNGITGSSPITAWTDLSGNSITNTINGDPALTTNSLNGYDVITFDGTGDKVTTNLSIDADTYPDLTVIALYVPRVDYAGGLWGEDNGGWDRFSLDDSFSAFQSVMSDGILGQPNIPNIFPTATPVITTVIFQEDVTNGTTVYANSALEHTFTSNHVSDANGSDVLRIGTIHGANNTYDFDGNIAEVIIYGTNINSAQRIILDNYLAAKYGRSLASNDIYDEDNVGNGNYDHEVAGIGRVDDSNMHDDAQGTGIVRILSPAGLGDDEFLMWGHNNGIQAATNTTDKPATLRARFDRVWRVSEVNSSNTSVDVGDIDIRFDLTELGFVSASDLSLLVDTDNDGIFSDETPIAGASSVGSNIYEFAGVSAIANNLRFTLGMTCPADPITSLDEAAAINTAGIYCFDIGGNTFETYVDANGYVQVAIDFGNGVGNLPQSTSLTAASRGILNTATLAALTETKEVRISSSTGDFDITTTNATIINRVQSNTTLHRGVADNAINDDWAGTNATYMTGNASCTTISGTSLHQNIVHLCGNTGGTHWIPSDDIQSVVGGIGSIPDTAFLQLWVRGNIAPGGVSTDLSLWLKADAGVTGTSAVTAWADQSTVGNDGTGVNTPALNSASLNFNNTISFVEPDEDYFTLDPSLLPLGNAARSYIAVADPTATGIQPVVSHGINVVNRRFDFFMSDDEMAVRINASNNMPSHTNTDPYIGYTSIDTDQNFNPNLKLFLNGVQLADNYTNGVVKLDTGMSIASIGANINRTTWFNGNIAEVIVYDRKLTTTEKQRAESYLALKYGITLDQTTPQAYLASDSTTKIWDETVNASYNNDIFGIGQDDASALDQKVSKSINANAIITIANNNDFTSANNAAGRTSLGNGNFAVIGNNNGAATWTATGAPAGYEILSKQWKIDETGTVGSLYIQFDVADADFDVPVPLLGTTYYIVVDTDDDQDLTDETPTILNNTSGNLWSTAVNFADGAIFALASFIQSPGGIFTNLQLWLKADAGVTGTTNVSQWNDQSGNILHATQGTVANQASLIANSINFNPRIDFDGSSDYMTRSASGLPIGNTDRAMIAVAIDTATAFDFRAIYDYGGTGANQSVLGRFNNGRIFASDGQGTTDVVGTAFGAGVPRLIALDRNSGTSELFEEGKSVATDAAPDWTTGMGTNSFIGRSSAGPIQFWQGSIAELIVYSDNLLSPDYNRIESYLALKYGITLDQSTPQAYVASGTTIWDATVNASYNNDIFGIGQDDDSGLDQKVSKSINANAIITIANNNDFTSANNDPGRTSLGNGNFAVIGNNNGTATWTTIGAPSEYKILSKQWKINETGTVGSLNIQFDVADADFNVPVIQAGADYYIVVDTDSDQDLSDETPIILNNTSGDLWSAAVDFADGAIFALASVVNQIPTDIKLDGADAESIDENRPSGSTFSTLTSVDTDTSDTHTYSLVSGTGDTNNASFTITGDQLKTNTTLDFETKNSYSIRIQTDDGNGGTYQEAFTISIINITTEVDATGVKVWDLNTPGDYTVSNATEAEIAEGIARLKLDRTPIHVGAITDNNTTRELDGAFDIIVEGDYAYVASALDDGVEILDISDPTNPTHVGAITDNGTTELDGARGIAVVGNYAYVASIDDDGVEILDISNPAAPTHVGAITDDGTTALDGAFNIVVVGKYAYVTSIIDDGVEILDISNPAAPTHVGAITDDATTALDGARGIAVVGNYAYVTSNGDNGVEILDISNPAAPTHVGVITDDATTALVGLRSITVVGNYAYVASNAEDGVEILDISIPTNPTHVGVITDDGTTELDGAFDIVVIGNYAYVASALDDGVEILDISDPTNPTHVGAITDDGTTELDGAISIIVVGNYAYVASIEDDGVEILDISGRYSTNSPYITANTAQTFTTSVDSFTEILAVDNEGTVSYQVSSDNGTTWKYWNGSAWTTTIQTDGTETSSAADINTNIVTLDTDGGDFLWRAYLESNGTQKVELDQIDITYNLSPTDIKLDGADAESIDENRPSGSAFSTLTSVDADTSDTHTYSFVSGTGDTDNASFTITGDQLKTNTTFDFETKNSYSIRIQTDDGNGGTYQENFTISIVDITTEVDAPGVKVWDFNTSGDYTVSNATEAEIAEGIARLKFDRTPIHVGAITDDGTTELNGAFDIIVEGDYAYIASSNDDGVEILDISNPASPTHVGAITNDATKELDGARGIAVVGNYAYVASVVDDGVEILDISNPAAPTHVGAITDDGTTALDGAYAITVVDNYAYVASIDDNGVEILDISNPALPTHVGVIFDDATTALDGARGIAVVGDYAYVTARDDNGVEILDISNPAFPTHVGVITDDATTALDEAAGITVVGDYAYVTSSGDDGVEILDISNPASPTHVGVITDDATTTLDGAAGISVVGNYAYVTSFVDDGVEILDISNPASPTHVGAITDNNITALNGAISIIVVGNYAYVASNIDAGVEILDISGYYSTNNPYVTPITPQTFTSTINSFTETLAVDNEGAVNYQVSSDNGTTWKYWNGSAWTTTTQTDGTQVSSATDINTNISTLDIDGGDFLWRAYLESDGSQKVELDQIDITFTFFFDTMRHGKRFLNEILQPYIKEN